MTDQSRATPSIFLEALQALPWVRKVSFSPVPRASVDGTLTVRAGHESFTLDVVQKRSYLDRASLHALIALGRLSKRPLIVFARYIPRPSGEQLMAAGLNFVDQAGNMHVALGKRYTHTLLGRREANPASAVERRVSAARIQLLFARAADPAILERPVREIAKRVGISESQAAATRHQLGERGQQATVRFPALHDRLLSGYVDVLRPKLLVGRFRAQETAPDGLIKRLCADAGLKGIRWSLTGGPAAERLQHLYRGPETTLFVDTWTNDIRQRLHLLPDRLGPVTVLRAFGELPFWQLVDGVWLAHPWLIYAELMYSEDPRAHEAAEELRRERLAA